MENFNNLNNNGYSFDDVESGLIFSEILKNLKEINLNGFDFAFKLINEINGLNPTNNVFSLDDLVKAHQYSKYLLNLAYVGISDIEMAISLFKTINGYNK